MARARGTKERARTISSLEHPISETTAAYRVWLAMMVATDVDACVALLRGESVDEDRLDGEWIRWAAERRLVRLDDRALGQLFSFADGRASLPPELLCAGCAGPIARAA